MDEARSSSTAKEQKAPARSARQNWNHRFHYALLLTHRYVGLTIAIFLIVASVTGSISAFKNELDAWLNPSLFQAPLPKADAKPLAPLVRREVVERQLAEGFTTWKTRSRLQGRGAQSSFI